MRNFIWGFVAAMSSVPSAGHAAWYEARSNHFTVYAEGKPDALKTYIAGLERYDSAMRTLYAVPDRGKSSSNRVTVFVVSSQSQIEKLYGRGGSGVAGFYDARAEGPVAFASTTNSSSSANDTALSARQVLFHEYAHHFMYTAWPDAPFPAWMIEGFAEFNGPAKIAENGDIVIGNPPAYRTWGIVSNAMPMRRLVAFNSVQRMDEEQRQALYGRGWLLQHYLLLDQRRSAKLAAYLKAIQEGKPSTEAATAAFGDLNKLDTDLDVYARGRLSGFRIPAKSLTVGPIEMRALTDGEKATLPALLRSRRGVDSKAAPEVALLAERLAAPYPNDAGAQNELAEAEFDAQHYEAADAAAARAAAADPKSVHALLYRGRAAMAIAQRDKTTDPARWTKVRSWFLAANKLDTENAEPLWRFYQSFVAEQAPATSNAQSALLYAQALAPFDSNLRFTAVDVLLRQEKAAEAATMLKPLAYDPHGSAGAQLASKLLDEIGQGDTKRASADLEGALKADASD
jgi:tetratricopeptide (TPR) repeat protein